MALNLFGSAIDFGLLKLFVAVRDKGGYDVVSKKDLWDLVAEESGVGSINSSTVKVRYIEYLNVLERCLENFVEDRDSTNSCISNGDGTGFGFNNLSPDIQSLKKNRDLDDSTFSDCDDMIVVLETDKHKNIAGCGETLCQLNQSAWDVYDTNVYEGEDSSLELASNVDENSDDIEKSHSINIRKYENAFVDGVESNVEFSYDNVNGNEKCDGFIADDKEGMIIDSPSDEEHNFSHEKKELASNVDENSNDIEKSHSLNTRKYENALVDRVECNVKLSYDIVNDNGKCDGYDPDDEEGMVIHSPSNEKNNFSHEKKELASNVDRNSDDIEKSHSLNIRKYENALVEGEESNVEFSYDNGKCDGYDPNNKEGMVIDSPSDEEHNFSHEKKELASNVDENSDDIEKFHNQNIQKYENALVDEVERNLEFSYDIGKCNGYDPDDEEVMIIDSPSVAEHNFSHEIKCESMLGMVNWITEIAKNPCNLVIGLLPKSSKWKSSCNEEIWKQVLLIREAMSLKGHINSYAEQNIHPCAFDNHQGSSYNLRKRTKSRRTLPFGMSSGRSLTRGMEDQLDQEIIATNDSWMPDYMGESPYKKIPLGPKFQIEVPEWSGITSESDSKWLGTRIWPLDKENQACLLKHDPIGKGRRDSCKCQVRGSSKCTQFHILKKRYKVKMELGDAFYRWKFDRMGEEVRLRWTEKEEHKFKNSMRSSSASLRRSFRTRVSKYFPFKSREDIVCYYFNVFLLHHRGFQNRFTPDNICSDDELELSCGR